MLGQQAIKSQYNNINQIGFQLGTKLGILVLLVCALVIIGLAGYIIKTKWHRHFITTKYTQVAYTHCSEKPLNQPHRQAFATLGIKFISPDNLHILEPIQNNNPQNIIYIPCSYNNSDWDIQQFLRQQPPNNNSVRWIISAVLGCNKLCAKNGLWSTLETTYGRIGAKEITPESWVIPGQSMAIQQIIQNSSEIPECAGKPSQEIPECAGKLSQEIPAFIFKKNIQGKQGLLLTNSQNDINQLISVGTNTSNKYSVAQRYLAQPYIIQGRKLNIRLYVLVVLGNGSPCKWWLYRSGKCIYTNREYQPLPLNTTIRSEQTKDISPGNMELLEQHFTSLNLDSEQVYKQEHCPETLDELQTYMSQQGEDWQQVWQAIQLGLQKVARAYHNKFTAPSKATLAYQVFGVDYILTQPEYNQPSKSNVINPYLLEFNKGPEMKYKSPRDPELKSGLQTDILELVLGQNQNQNTNNNKWIQINSLDKGKRSTKIIKKQIKQKPSKTEND